MGWANEKRPSKENVNYFEDGGNVDTEATLYRSEG